MTGQRPGRAPAGRWALLCLALGGLAALGRFHRLHDGDSLVPALVSLQRWTPFYWEQARFGMLVPLLAAPVRSPLWNLVVQTALDVAGGVGAFLFVARLALPGAAWPIAGALSAAVLVLCAPPHWSFYALAVQPYALSLGLAAASAVAVDRPGRLARWRWPAAILCGAAAHWVSVVAAVPILPLAAGRAWLEAGPAARGAGLRGRLRAVVRGEPGRPLRALVAGLALGQAWHAAAPGHVAENGLSPLREWPAGWVALARHGFDAAPAWNRLLVGAAVAGLALAALPPLRRAAAPALRAFPLLVLSALAWAVFAGATRWVQANGYGWRYLIPTQILLHTAAVVLVAAPAEARLAAAAARARTFTWAASAAVLVAAALWAWGWPSPARARADLDETLGRHTAAILAAGCQAVAGDYWTVWPAVFHANLALKEGRRAAGGRDGGAAGAPVAQVYGLSHRASATFPLWDAARRSPGLRLCVVGDPRNEAQARHYLAAYGLPPLRLLGRAGGVLVLGPAGAADEVW
ncbi:hypothetical protein [Anaeromyxobacter paludicola]|uniref:Glycosyltransferase RgtA/B/C/D-like domain-containing protein n=1 Tax=Anaeromyxobacter paludicola TaxID=2918171 RepID=A0ABN6N5A4_9BACT|nr:hypothetical protein [Anaeromyxobacter paludicola]BDG07033.1 hypothetical protein AMPC_01460 [Anaeromyxobacter paludicola]